MTTRDRGEYRPIYVALVDGPDFQAMPAECRWVLVCVKLSLGVFGIAAVPGLTGALAERTGYSERRVAGCLLKLESAGWIERERNVTWLVRGLEFEPAMSADNALHRKSLLRHIEALPRLPIVERFRRAYRPWSADGPPIPPDTQGYSPSIAPRITETETETLTDTETVTTSSVGAHEGDPPVTEGSQVARLINRLRRTSDRWAVWNLIDRIPDREQPGWIGQLNGYLDGMDLPAGMQPTPEQLATACRDYACQPGVKPNPLHFRAYVRRVLGERPARAQDGPAGPRRGTAATGAAALEAGRSWAERKQAELERREANGA